MTVYELIQELSKYKADTEVVFHLVATIDADVKAEFDRDNEDDVQDVTVDVDFDDNLYFEDIFDNERSKYSPNVTIELEY